MKETKVAGIANAIVPMGAAQVSYIAALVEAQNTLLREISEGLRNIAQEVKDSRRYFNMIAAIKEKQLRVVKITNSLARMSLLKGEETCVLNEI